MGFPLGALGVGLPDEQVARRVRALARRAERPAALSLSEFLGPFVAGPLRH